MKRTLATIALLATAGAGLTACGDDTDGPEDSAGGASSSTFDDADVEFAQQMIPHHQQAVQMARMAESHAGSAEVRRLAEDIETAQAPEIETMSEWLEEWGQEVPSRQMHHGDMGHGTDEEMPGMMDEMEMGDLEESSGGAWDAMFLEMMIEHHEGAIEMARDEVAHGEDPEAVALAEKVIEDQQAEIAQMQEMLRPAR